MTIERMIKVTDNWCPCYPNHQIKLILNLNFYNGLYYTRLSAWGYDDFGLELYFESRNEEETKKKYEEFYELYCSIPDGVDQDFFYELGFTQF